MRTPHRCNKHGTGALGHRVFLVLPVLALCACGSTPPQDDQNELVALGEQIFFNETFDGNGRTCGTCHRAEDNFGLSPAFIARLPADDPLFVAEFNDDLAEGFESPALMRQFGLIRENQDGFDDLAANFNLRGIPNTLALNTSVRSSSGPRTGWSGDGAPGDGSLRAFSVGAIIQHFPKTTRRIAGVDFRMPNGQELDALEAFMLSLGRQQDINLPLSLSDGLASRGQRIFLDNALGKCNICHVNAGANVDPAIFGSDAGNGNFNTGVADLPGNPARATGALVPLDDGFGTPGNGEFNTPPLIEAADTAPFFHDNSAATLEASIAFYDTDTFNNSPAGRMLAGVTGAPLSLNDNQVSAVAAFLRVLNVLENIRSSTELMQDAKSVAEKRRKGWSRQLMLAAHETEDAFQVLRTGGLHADASANLQAAMADIKRAQSSKKRRVVRVAIDAALAHIEQARARLLGPPSLAGR